MTQSTPPLPPSQSPFGGLSVELLNALGIAVAVIDRDGHVAAFNHAWKNLMRAPIADEHRPLAVRHCLPSLFTRDQVASIIDEIQTVLDGRASEFISEYRANDDIWVRWYRLTIKSLPPPSVAVMIACDEIRAPETTGQTLKQSRDHLYQAQKMEALGTLVAGVAHEINNPISLIMFNLPIIKRVWQDILPVVATLPPGTAGRKFGGFTLEYLQSHFSQLVDDMDMAANRVSKIVKDLKNFSRQSHVSDKKSLQINEAVKNAVRLARTTIQKSGVELSLELQADLPTVVGNLPSIEQIILNILINAIQAIEGPSGKITIRTGRNDANDRVFVSVTDNGHGVSPQIAGKIFDPFVTDKQTRGGSGLGLSVSYSLAQAHGGTIAFEPAADHGTTFSVWLPYGDVHERKKVLVVDDDALVRKLIVEILSVSGRYHVEEAASGIDGLLRIGTTTPDMLILDLKMPGMNGLDVCRAVRQNDQLADMKVLITTGHPEHPDLDEIRAMGYTDNYIKPVRVESFRQMVELVMRPSAGGK